jgi:hypothetical protein
VSGFSSDGKADPQTIHIPLISRKRESPTCSRANRDLVLRRACGSELPLTQMARLSQLATRALCPMRIAADKGDKIKLDMCNGVIVSYNSERCDESQLRNASE